MCRVYAEKQGWTVADSYHDRAVSGASLIRAGIQALLADALRGLFEVVLAEALDRISRDQEDVAGVFKRMAFAGVKDHHAFGGLQQSSQLIAGRLDFACKLVPDSALRSTHHRTTSGVSATLL